MSGSTVPTIKALIVTTLQARARLSGVQVLYSDVGEARQRERIYLGEVRGHHEFAALGPGRKRRKETYTADLWVEVEILAGTIQSSDARAFVLMKEVEDMIADDPQLGSPSVLDAAGIGNWELRNDITDRGALSRIRVEIECSAQLA